MGCRASPRAPGRGCREARRARAQSAVMPSAAASRCGAPAPCSESLREVRTGPRLKPIEPYLRKRYLAPDFTLATAPCVPGLTNLTALASPQAFGYGVTVTFPLLQLKFNSNILLYDYILLVCEAGAR